MKVFSQYSGCFSLSIVLTNSSRTPQPTKMPDDTRTCQLEAQWEAREYLLFIGEIGNIRKSLVISDVP
jgi:hypothetical protein